MPELLLKHRIWHRSKNISGFKKFRLWVHITTHPFRLQSDSPLEPGKHKYFQSFLISKESLHDFVYILRVADMMMECHFNFKIVVNKNVHGDSASIGAQKALLMPFTKLQGRHQKCVINGAASGLARSVTTLLTPNIHWERFVRMEL